METSSFHSTKSSERKTIMNTFHNFFSNFQFYLQPVFNIVQAEACIKRKELTNTELPSQHHQKQQLCIDDDIKLSKREIEMVMDRLELVDYEHCGEEEVNGKELSKMFEENEPTLEELKKAFDVFDENKDGFIDAVELRRVMWLLGIKEGSEVEACRRMIRRVDENGDGFIDFDEFVKFMEKCLC